MGHFCYDTIIATATTSEWACIEAILKSGAINLSDSEAITVGYGRITCENKYRSGINEHALLNLSRMFPCAIFCWCSEMEDYPPQVHYYVSGKVCTLYGAARARETAVRKESKRFLKQVKCTDSSFLFLDRFDEPVHNTFRTMLDIKKVPQEIQTAKQISFGDFHSCALFPNGQIVTWGFSSAVHRSNISLSSHSVRISCGRHHTAVLLENGTVQVLGSLCKFPKEIQTPNGQKNICPEYPLQFHLTHTNAYNRTENCKAVCVGDTVILKKVTALNEIEAFTTTGLSLGLLKNTSAIPVKSIIPDLRHLTASVSEKTLQGTKSLPTIKIRVEKKHGPLNGTLNIQKYTHWQNIINILSVFDGVFGLCADGRIFQDGNCGEYSLSVVVRMLKFNTCEYPRTLPSSHHKTP